jgi:tetratricopeptide (TPR) repeat protein
MAVTLMLAFVLLLGQQPETLSLLGEPLYAPPMSRADRTKADEALAAARAAYAAAPNDVGAIIALEQAHLNFGRVGDALEVLTHGIGANPEDARLRLERGRSYIRIRKFEPAQRDLRKAAETLPSAQCPLGLALYLAADYGHAQQSYAKCADPGIFGYLSARRAGAAATAPSDAALGPKPSTAPPPRFPGALGPDASKERVPIGKSYLDAVEALLSGQKDAARTALKKIVEKDREHDWMEPAYIAAEADYARIHKLEKKKKKKT